MTSAQAQETPLHRAQTAAVADPGLVMTEAKLLGHLNLRGNPNDGAFLAAAEAVLGLALPLAPLTSAEQGDTVAYWLCPNEWLLLVAPGTQAEVEAKLREAMAGQHIAVTDISSAQTLVNLSGPALDLVLQKSTVYDCHPDNLPAGKVVQTTFAKTGTTLRRRADGSVDLIVRRSFADYFFAWLEDASAEYGLQVN